jgi:hypothetical protein
LPIHVEDHILNLDQARRSTDGQRLGVVGRDVGELDLDARLRRLGRRLDRHDDLPRGDIDVASLDQLWLRRTLQNNLRGVDVEVALQGPLRGFERLINEGVEFDILQIGARLAAYEIKVLAVALAAIAKAQGRPSRRMTC